MSSVRNAASASFPLRGTSRVIRRGPARKGKLISAQTAAPTTNVFTRMTMVELRFGRGLTFSIDVDQREYWITAKHILTGAKHLSMAPWTENQCGCASSNPGAQGEEWISVDFSVMDPASFLRSLGSALHSRLAPNKRTKKHPFKFCSRPHLPRPPQTTAASF